MHSIYELTCPSCEAANLIDNGDVNDMTAIDIEDFKCWNCSKSWALDDQGDPVDEIDDASSYGYRPSNVREPGTVNIKFDNDKAAEHFMHWLDGQGEQDYWVWMECREQEKKNKGDITATSFDYKFKQFQVVGKCGRLDKD